MSLPGILVVSEVFPPAIGGSGALLHSVYRHVREVPVRVLAGDAPGGVTSKPADALVLDTWRVAMSAPDWGVVRPTSLARHLRVSKTIRRMLRSAPAAVHCARVLPEGLSAAMAVFHTGASYVCWTHGEELGFASTSRELTWLARRVHSGARAVIANSRNSARLLESNWAVPPEKIHVVYPGVETTIFRPDLDARVMRARLGLAPEDFVLLSVGRLQRRKGHDLVLKALSDLRGPVPEVRYVIVGDGSHRPVLERQAHALGLDPIVRFHGVASSEDLPRLYAAADVFVLPNRDDGVDFEGFGIVFLEAAACGLPVVAGRSGGVPEAVADGETGLLVSGSDAAELASVLARLAASPDWRRRLGAAGRARVESGFTWEAAAQSVTELHRVMCGAGATPRGGGLTKGHRVS